MKEEVSSLFVLIDISCGIMDGLCVCHVDDSLSYSVGKTPY